MKRIRSIALFLSAVLLAPVGYRYIHVAEHHRQPDCGHHCNAEKERLPQEESREAQGHENHGEKPCPVVEFEFFASNLPESAPEITYFSTEARILIPQSVSAGFVEESGHTIPRGPPAYHFIHS